MKRWQKEDAGESTQEPDQLEYKSKKKITKWQKKIRFNDDGNEDIRSAAL